MRTVREVAELAGVTVRALHHYDEIGLLKPSGRNESGYRLYSHGDLLRLREIVAWRQLGFSLREVQELVDEPEHDRAAALRRQLTLARDQLARVAALVDALAVAVAAHDNREPLQEQTMFEGLTSMIPLVLVDAGGEELGRCSIESGARFLREGAPHSVDLGPVGYFRILDVHSGDPTVVVAEPAERIRWAYAVVIRQEGTEQRRAFLGGECSFSVGDRMNWPPERGQAPVEHEVVAIRPASDDSSNSVVVIERVA
jgi:DNA-binding transcriptional MerR regulator